MPLHGCNEKTVRFEVKRLPPDGIPSIQGSPGIEHPERPVTVEVTPDPHGHGVGVRWIDAGVSGVERESWVSITFCPDRDMINLRLWNRDNARPQGRSLKLVRGVAGCWEIQSL
jgi:hypothetical protein